MESSVDGEGTRSRFDRRAGKVPPIQGAHLPPVVEGTEGATPEPGG